MYFTQICNSLSPAPCQFITLNLHFRSDQLPVAPALYTPLSQVRSSADSGSAGQAACVMLRFLSGSSIFGHKLYSLIKSHPASLLHMDMMTVRETADQAAATPGNNDSSSGPIRTNGQSVSCRGSGSCCVVWCVLRLFINIFRVFAVVLSFFVVSGSCSLFCISF